MAANEFPTLAELSGEYLAEIAQKAGEPEWLVARRTEAWDFFVQTLPPEWRRTDLRALNAEAIAPHLFPQGTAIQWDASLAEKGIVFTSLAAALQHQHHETLVRDNLGKAIAPHAHKFSALRAALWQDGVLLYVPRNTALEVPLRVSYTLAEGSRAIFPYSLVVLEPGARVTFVEEFCSYDAAEPALAGPTTEIILGEGSSLHFVSIQQWGENVYHIGSQVQLFGRDAQSDWISLSLGGQVQHTEAEARMQGDGSVVRWRGATLAHARQRLLTAPLLRHDGAHTESHLDFRTIVTDEGYSAFDGMIAITKPSRNTTTRLEEHAIHLSDTARSDSIPGLKIDTNDVASAGHACTSGQIDEEQLFYLQTRGIGRDAAIRMVVMGFFEPVLNALPYDELRESLKETLEERV